MSLARDYFDYATDTLGMGPGSKKFFEWGDKQIAQNPDVERYQNQAGTMGTVLRTMYEGAHATNDFSYGNYEGTVDHGTKWMGNVEKVVPKILSAAKGGGTDGASAVDQDHPAAIYAE